MLGTPQEQSDTAKLGPAAMRASCNRNTSGLLQLHAITKR
jgi:hypothetical protein